MASQSDILNDPGAHTVEEVTSALAKSTPGEVAKAKALEAQGQDRKGIADFELPAEQPAPTEPTFTRERLLGEDGPAITGASHPVIVGALYGDSTAQFTRGQVNRKVEEFLARPVQEA